MANEEAQFVARAERLAGPTGVVGFQRAAAREAAAGRRRPDAGADLAALAKQLGIQGARPGESMADFKARVMSAAEAAMGAASVSSISDRGG